MKKKTLENICLGGLLGSGITLQLTTYYLKYIQPAIYCYQGMYQEAAISHASGYVPSIAAKVLLASAGVMYLSQNDNYEHILDRMAKYKYLRLFEPHVRKQIQKRKNGGKKQS